MKNLRAAYRQRFGIKTDLRGYQLKAAKKGTDNDNVALLMAPRLGKTRVDIAITGYRWNQGQIKRWVIICPAIAKHVWREEIAATLDIPYIIDVIEGKAKERTLTLKGWKDEPGKLSILIMNHEATWRLKKFLYKWNPTRITVDESHKIARHSSKQSACLHVLSRRATYRSILTGTFMSKVTDVFSQFKFLDPTIFGTNWKQFLGEYVRTYGFGGFKPKTFKNLDDMEAKVDAVAFKLDRQSAGGFPEEQIQVIRFDLTNPTLRHYKDMEDTLRTLVNGVRVNAEIVLTQTLRLSQITGGFLPVKSPDDDLAVNVALGDDRISALRGVLEEYPLTEPIVIFTKFRYEMTAVKDLLTTMKRTYVSIAGGMKTADRDQAKLSFQDGLVNTCVAQVRAGGIAIDLSRADNAIFFSLTPSYIDFEQAKARIIARTGGKVALVLLVATGTVDEDTVVALTERRELVDVVMGRLKGKL